MAACLALSAASSGWSWSGVWARSCRERMYRGRPARIGETTHSLEPGRRGRLLRASAAAAAARADGPRTPSSVYAFCRCRSTVRTLRTSSAAISSFERPSATSATTSRSRADSTSAAGPGRRPGPGTAHLVDEDLPRGLVPSTMWLSLSSATSRAPGSPWRGAGRARSRSSGRRPVEHQGRYVEPGQQVDRSSPSTAAAARRGGRGRGGDPLQLVEPEHLLLGGPRDHHRGEDPPEGVLRPGPPDLDQLRERLELPWLSIEPAAAPA